MGNGGSLLGILQIFGLYFASRLDILVGEGFDGIRCAKLMLVYLGCVAWTEDV